MKKIAIGLSVLCCLLGAASAGGPQGRPASKPGGDQTVAKAPQDALAKLGLVDVTAPPF